MTHQTITDRKQTELPFSIRWINPLRQLFIWSEAWREYSQFKELDQNSLEDMGITEEARDKVSVREIATRIRSQS